MKKSILSHIFFLFVSIIILTTNPLPLTYINVASVGENIPAYTQSSSINNVRDLKTTIVTQLNNRSTTFTIPYTGPTANLMNELNNIIQEVSVEHQYLYYTLNSWKYGFEGFTNNVVISFDITYMVSRAEEQFIEAEVDRILKDIITPGMTSLEKVKAVNDYIVLNTIYSTDTKNSPHSPYTILVEGKGVCQAYSLLGYKMFRKLGFEVMYVVGDAGEPHAWNLIKIDGEWYHLDMTWNDPVPDKLGNITYKYFLVTDSYLSKTHTWDTSKYPRATSNRFSYLHSITSSTTFNSWIYLSNESDGDRLYKMYIDGSGRTRLTSNRAYYIAVAGDWVYYSNYSDRGYMYKVTTSGNQNQRVNSSHTIDIFEKDGWLYYTLASNNRKEKIFVGANNLNQTNWLDLPSRFSEPLNKDWTIRFNSELDAKTVNTGNILIALDKNGHYPISGFTVALDPSNPRNIVVRPPASGWSKGHTYYLLITDNIASTNGTRLTRGVRMRFTT